MIVIEIIAIVFIFIFAVFITWYFGKKEFLPEEKTIDLILVSTLVGLITARIAFFISPIGQDLLNSITKVPNTFWLIMELFNLRTGLNWVVGLICFSIVSLILIWRWKWFVWPIWGICLFSALIFITLNQILFLIVNQIPTNLVEFAILVILECVFIFAYKLNGITIIKHIWNLLKEKLKSIKKHSPLNPNSHQPSSDN